jgi:hypothetical protein
MGIETFALLDTARQTGLFGSPFVLCLLVPFVNTSATQESERSTELSGRDLP